MTSDPSADDEITTTDQFEHALHSILSEAIDNGVDPRGSWECRTDEAATDWEVMVVELQERAGSEGSTGAGDSESSTVSGSSYHSTAPGDSE